jgi:sphingomyelin phosphodiesterase
MKQVLFLPLLLSTSFSFLFEAPCNLFPTPIIRSDNITWLYEALADSWLKLGLPSDTRDSIVRGAFYTTIVRPGLRLISLNMNYCAPENYWLFINATDPLDQLQWVSFQIQKEDDYTSIIWYFSVDTMVTIC